MGSADSLPSGPDVDFNGHADRDCGGVGREGGRSRDAPGARGIETVRQDICDGGIDAWREAGLGLAHLPQITVDDLHNLIEKKTNCRFWMCAVTTEYESGHVPHAVQRRFQNCSDIPDLALDPAKPTAVICAGGYRSSAATSILEQHGFKNLLNVTGGTGAWIKAGYPVEVQVAVTAHRTTALGADS